jgi:hypothetical protein
MKPQTFGQLFDFYNRVVKLLYSAVQADNNMPQETLFEINAAFDHLARHWTEGEDEPFVAEKVYSHLKRGCLDIFKILYRDTIDDYKRLSTIDTSIIDNGRFDADLWSLVSEIKTGARDARRLEGKRAEENGIDEAFDRWSKVFENCEKLRENFINNPNVNWARHKTRMYGIKAFVLAIVASVVAGIIISPAVISWGKSLFSWVSTICHKTL